MGDLVIGLLALAVAVIFRSKPLISGWKWMLCTVSGLYAAIFAAVPAAGMFDRFLPENLRSCSLALTIMLVFVITLLVLNIAMEKLAPNGEFYRFPALVEKAAAAVCRGVAGISVAVMILQVAAVVPLPVGSVPYGAEMMQAGERWMVRIAGVVNRCSGQNISSEEVSRYLAGLKYTAPEENAAEEQNKPAGGEGVPAASAGKNMPPSPDNGGSNK